MHKKATLPQKGRVAVQKYVVVQGVHALRKELGNLYQRSKYGAVQTIGLEIR
jgi:hypothetical protein